MAETTTAFTYRATTEAGQGMTLSGTPRFIDTHQGVVVRSDGKTVWRGGGYGGGDYGKRRAQFDANRWVGHFRRYLARTGRCYSEDRDGARQARREWDEARRKAISNLQTAIARGFNDGLTWADERKVPAPYPEHSLEQQAFDVGKRAVFASGLGAQPPQV